MNRRGSPESARLDYESTSHREPPNPAVVAADRWARYRKFRMILRVIYLLFCLALLGFGWKYIQGYIQLLDNAAKQ